MTTCNNFNNLEIRESILNRIKFQNYSRETDESWKLIPWAPEYKISSNGRVFNSKSFGGKIRELVPTLRNNKNFYVTLTINNKRVGYALDRLVIAVFNNIEYKDLRSVIHIDGLSYNSSFKNLRFITK